MLDSLDAAAVRRWCAAGLAGLRRHQSEIDDLNVYPVPDGDTGTNLVLTVAAAADALAARPAEDGLAGTLHCMASGALLGARGNSGVIMSELLGGMARALVATPVARGRELAGALAEGANAAYRAVSEPVEGTILTVARSAARCAAATPSDDLASAVRAAADGAAQALAITPQQLPALARAGVVDAGGRGLVVMLDALVEVATGVVLHRPGPPARALAAVRDSGSGQYAYEVQYLLETDDNGVARLRAALGPFGDSLLVVGAPVDAAATRTWNVHVHVNDVGAALEAGLEVGRPYRISVTRFADHPAPPSIEPVGTPAATPPAAPDLHARADVVVVAGTGLARLFAAEGAQVVAASSPSTAEVLEAIRAGGAAWVVVLPNDRDAHAVATAAAVAARVEGFHVGVVPTRSPVQALAALAVRDPQRRFEDDMIAMAEAAGACRYAEVTTAARAAVTVAGVCQPGDVLALVEGEVNLIGTDLLATCRTLLDRMLAGGGELVTLITGGQAPDGLADHLIGHLNVAWPFAEVVVYHGEQPRYPLLVGVE